MKRRYLHLQNTHFLFGGFTSAGLQVLENGLTAWDADSGIPSRLIQHNQTSSKPPTFSSAVAGLVAEEGKGSRFVVEPNGGEGRAPELQVCPVQSQQGWQEVIGVPMRYVLKGSRNMTQGYTVYLHSIIRRDYTALTYYGITSRHWLKRLKEHVASATTGSPLLFHRALREDLGTAARFQHTIIGAGLTKDEAYDVEEYLIDKYSLAPNFENGLNMVPGGYEGLRRLHEMGLLAEGTGIEPEEQEGLLERYAREHPRRGVANPLISERWKDDAYAEAVICGRDNRLTAQQVRQIRMLAALGHTADDITALSGASNESQVRLVVEKRTYARIR
jgi:hypothetical protein